MRLIDKKIVSLFLIVIFSVMVFIPGAQASNNIQVFINGQEKNFTPSPVIKNGSTLVPMRAFFEALGCEVKWDSKTRTAIGVRDGKEVKLPIGSKTAFVNGEKKRLTVEAQLINSSTFIPLRFVGEALGDEVIWNNGVIRIQTRYRERERAGDQIVKVHFLDVGQADSIYIQAPDNYDILIDGGNNSDGSLVVNYLKNQNVDDIEILIATHSHEDHIGGLDDVLKAFRVERIIDSGEAADTKTYQDYWEAVNYEVNREGAIYLEDDDLHFDIGDDIDFDIIELGDGYDDTNNNSVVTLLDYKDNEFLFTGDLESDVETKLIGKIPAVDVLKVGHHGSNSSTSNALLQSIKPSIAVISVGKNNRYGHPHQETLQRLSERNIEILRTDLNGTIVIVADGTTLKIFREKDYKDTEGAKEKPTVGNEYGNVVIKSIDLKNEVVVIENKGTTDIDMSGWKLVSIKGNQTFYFPNGFILKAGMQVRIWSGKNAIDNPPTDLKWTGAYIWNNEGDPGVIYDDRGNIVSQYGS